MPLKSFSSSNKMLSWASTHTWDTTVIRSQTSASLIFQAYSNLPFLKEAFCQTIPANYPMSVLYICIEQM